MIPTKWDQISTRQYMAINRSKKKEATTTKERIDLLIERMCIVTKQTPETVMQMPLHEFKPINELLDSQLPTKIYKQFCLDGIWYEFILNPKELNAEQFAGIKEAIKADPEQGYAMVLYYLARPFKNFRIKKRYFETQPEDVPDVIESFHNLPITVSYPIVVFFLKLCVEYKSYFEDYSLNQIQEAKNKVNQSVIDLQKHTVGLKQ